MTFRLLILVLLLLSIASVSAQFESPLLIQVSPEFDLTSRPARSVDAVAITINTDLLVQSTAAETLKIQLPGIVIPEMFLIESDSYINGDLSFRAQAMDDSGLYSLVLTLGDRILFGHLSGPAGSYQIEAAMAGSGFRGWIYRPGELTPQSAGFQNDYLIPNKELRLQKMGERSFTPLVLPLTLFEDTVDIANNPASTSEVTIAGGFSVDQRFNRRAVQVGQTVDIQLTVKNISSSWKPNSSIDFYFLLEDSLLVAAPGSCREQISASLQKVLNCNIGSFAPGEQKSGIITVKADLNSKPVIISTAILGELRSDAYINVVDDVRTDTDNDGISDFNEVILGTDPADPDSLGNDFVTIDVMAFYTQGAANLYPGSVKTRINQLISVANQSYAGSGVGITLRPVYHGLVDYNDSDDMDTALSHIIDKTHPAFAGVDLLRTVYGGDLVMLFRPLGEDNSRCGLATVGGFNTEGYFDAAIEREFAYSHIGIDCPKDLVVAHELGHNMGLTHSHLEDGQGGTFNFSTGYGVDSEFVTIMAYPGAFNTDAQVARFSNPTDECFGVACGRNADEDFGADASLSLNIVKFQIAEFFPSRVPELPLRQAISISGAETGASIAIAASDDNGLSFSQTVTTKSPIDISIAIRPDSEHVDRPGSIHVVLSAVEGEYWQVDSLGNLTRWDGDLNSLGSYNGLRPLKRHEQLKLTDDFQFDTSFTGLDLSIFVAYSIPELNELIYTPEPLVLYIRAAP